MSGVNNDKTYRSKTLVYRRGHVFLKLKSDFIEENILSVERKYNALIM